MVLGHLGVNVPDLAAAKAYYDNVMPTVGFEPFLATSDELAYRPTNGKVGTYLFFYPSLDEADYSRHRTGLQHLAFIVPTRSTVHSVHALAMNLGSVIVHEPRHFPEYGPSYFATFWTDPFRAHARSRVSSRPRLTARHPCRSGPECVRGSGWSFPGSTKYGIPSLR